MKELFKRRIGNKRLKEIKSNTKKVNWYRQAADCKFLYVSTPSYGVVNQMDYPVIYFADREYSGCLSLKNINKESQEFFEKSKKDSKEIDAYYKKFLSVYSAIMDLVKKKARKIDFKKDDLDNIRKVMIELDKLSHDLWYYGYLVDKFDPKGDVMLKKELKNHNLKLDEEEIATLIKSKKLNFVNKSNLEITRIALRIFGKNAQDKELLSELKPLAEKYFYIQNSWGEVFCLKEKDFLKPLKNLLKQPKERLVSTIKKYEDSEKNINNQCKKIFKKYKIPEKLEHTFHLFRILATLRDDRKEAVLVCNYYYELTARRFAKEYDEDIEIIRKAFPLELLTVGKEEILPVLRKRKEFVAFGHFSKKEEDFILSGKEAEEIIRIIYSNLMEKYEELKGMVACKGEGGIIKGKVKIILGETHFSKFKEGDILVASMTRPEYISLMKKAKAIITDEGGITSHAAIVSRELGIPCVIGTHVATKKLVDGEMIIIDADKGVIRKIK